MAEVFRNTIQSVQSFVSGPAVVSELERMNIEEVFADSPMLRDKIRRQEQSAENFAGRVHVLAKLATGTVKAERAQGEASKKFIAQLHSFGVPEQDHFQKAIVRLATALTELNNFREMLCQQLENVFIEPLESFSTELAAKSKKSGQAFGTAVSAMDAATKKLASTPRTASDDVQQTALADVESARRAFESTGMQHIADLNEVRAKKDFAFVEHVLSLVYMQNSFFHQGYDLLNAMQPAMNDLAKAAQVERERYDREQEDTALRQKKLTSREQRPTVDVKSIRGSGTSGGAMEGYLFKRSTSIRKDWKKRFFAIRNGQLLYFKNGSDLKPVHAIDTVLCSGKRKMDSERRAVFEIITPQRSYVLQAETDVEVDDWLAALQASTADMLKSDRASLRTPTLAPPVATTPDALDSGSADCTGSNDDDYGGVSPTLVKARAPTPRIQKASRSQEVWAADEGNKRCCDCGERSPKWCSLNLGVVFCINCSGIHRSLGVHISKVRSLELDKLDAVSLQLFRKIGNRRFNEYWEATLPADYKKDGSVSRVDVAHFIRYKYLDRKWLKPLDVENIDDVEPALYAAVAAADGARTLHLLNHGTRATAVLEAQEGRSPIHEAAKQGLLWMVELLYHNGADINARDVNGRTALHYAVQSGQPAVAGLLLLRGINADLPDNAGQTPLDLAAARACADCVTLLRLARLSKEEKGTIDENDESSSFSIAFKSFIEDACARDST